MGSLSAEQFEAELRHTGTPNFDNQKEADDNGVEEDLFDM